MSLLDEMEKLHPADLLEEIVALNKAGFTVTFTPSTPEWSWSASAEIKIAPPSNARLEGAIFSILAPYLYSFSLLYGLEDVARQLRKARFFYVALFSSANKPSSPPLDNEV